MSEDLIALVGGRHGHFELESGYHGECWFDLDRLFTEPAKLRPHVAELAARLAVHRPAAVCGPMTGGARLAELVASELGVEYLFTERVVSTSATGLFPVRYVLPLERRGAVAGKVVVMVDDAVSAGSAIRGTFADLVACGARPVAIGALFVFGGAAAQFAAERNLALEFIVQRSFGLWTPAECPLCKSGVALEKVAPSA